MPITKTEFRKGKIVNPTEEAIKDFLRRNPDKAYTASEITGDGLGYASGENFLQDLLVLFGVINFLDILLKERAVVKRQIGFETYYRIND